MEVNTREQIEVAMKVSPGEQTVGATKKVSIGEQTEGATKKVSIGERTEGATKKGTTGERIMKKVSTGERIKLEDLRRRSVGGQRNADIDVTSEQRFVSELMDTTPSSSYEEPSKDLTSNLDASVSDSPLPKYDSDVEADDEVVTGTQDTVTKTDLIVKEDVPEIPGETQQGSLLAAELAAVKFVGSQPSQTASARQRDDTLSDGESLMGDPRVDHGADHGRGGGGCTAEQLIRALVSECQTLELSSDLRQPSDKYVLRMADEDWDPDLDFPGLDSSAVITDVGVDQFVLCHQAKNEPMLHVTIALHEGLNGSLTGTGAVEAPGAGATMTLEVNFRIPGQEETHHMSVRIAPDSSGKDLPRSRDSGAVSAVGESEEIVRTESDGKENHVHDGHDVPDGKVEEINSEGNRPVSEAATEEETLKLRNIDTGEDIELGDIDERVPPSLDPGELFRSKDVS